MRGHRSSSEVGNMCGSYKQLMGPIDVVGLITNDQIITWKFSLSIKPLRRRHCKDLRQSTGSLRISKPTPRE